MNSPWVLMFLTSLEKTIPIEIVTPDGTERGISYLGLIFVADRSYKDKESAIAACRHDLDIGLAAIVVLENGRYTLWCSVPAHMLVQIV